MLLTGLIASLLEPEPAAEPLPLQPMRFGVEASAVPVLEGMQAKPDYGTVWVGAWNLNQGWRATDAALRRLVAENVTPAIHVYYWGDDLNVTCLERGCWSGLHGAWKDGPGWQRLFEELAIHLDQTVQGRPVLLLLETEFNKLDHEPLDGYLAYKAEWLRASVPNATVALAFGNWAPERWPQWDRAAAASDAVGLQGLRALSRDSADSYGALFDSALDGARRLHLLF